MFKDNEGEEAFGPTMTYWKWWKEDAKHDGKVAGLMNYHNHATFTPKKMIDIIRSSHILCISYDIKSYLPLQAWYFRWSQPGTPRAGLVPYRVPAFWCTVLRRDWHEEFWLKPDMESKYSTKLFPGWRFKVSAFQVSIFQDLFEDVSVDIYIYVCVFSCAKWIHQLSGTSCARAFSEGPKGNHQITLELNQGTQRLRCKIYKSLEPKVFPNSED